MKKALMLSVMILFIAAYPAWGKKSPTRLFRLQDTVVLNGAQIPAGIYELTWETHGSSARVTLSKDGQFVATAPARWVKSGLAYSEDEALLRANSDGSKALIEIRIAHSGRTIVFAGTDGAVHYSAMKH